MHVNKEEAFAVAAVFIMVCNKLPDLCAVILGDFYIRCPYLVPIYKPKPKDLSDKDYRLSVGYNLNILMLFCNSICFSASL